MSKLWTLEETKKDYKKKDIKVVNIVNLQINAHM
jgi:hypothetical protein